MDFPDADHEKSRSEEGRCSKSKLLRKGKGGVDGSKDVIRSALTATVPRFAASAERGNALTCVVES